MKNKTLFSYFLIGVKKIKCQVKFKKLVFHVSNS